jgi:hypothetical protein
VRYSGPFGFIKPWTAVRDAGGGETYSQQFLTPSIVEGIRQKLEVKEILRHKLTYAAIDLQQEVVKAKAWKLNRKEYTRESSILKRGVLINPCLYLAFGNFRDTNNAVMQHICLCRNEDILLPDAKIIEMSEQEFDDRDGYELRFGKSEKSFLVGYDRFNNNEEMYGWIDIVGNPIKNSSYE